MVRQDWRKCLQKSFLTFDELRQVIPFYGLVFGDQYFIHPAVRLLVLLRVLRACQKRPALMRTMITVMPQVVCGRCFESGWSKAPDDDGFALNLPILRPFFAKKRRVNFQVTIEKPRRRLKRAGLSARISERDVPLHRLYRCGGWM